MPTPYELVSSTQRPARATRHELLLLSRELEAQARLTPPTLVRAALQDVRHVSQKTIQVYAELATRSAEVVLLARGLQAFVAVGVRGVDLADDDPLVDQWCVVLAGGAAPVAMVATDLGGDEPVELNHSYSYALTRDPELVRACAEALS